MADENLYLHALARMLEQVKEPRASSLRASASIIPWRKNQKGTIEVFWVKRSPTLGVLGGWYAFPGGGQNRTDAELPFLGLPVTHQDLPSRSLIYDVAPSEDDLTPGIIACALRELFEEIGILLTENPMQGTPPSHRDFAKALSEQNARLIAHRLVFAGRWITPPISPFRFDTRFFLLEWPQEEAVQPLVDGQELSEGEWIECETALGRWRDGDILAAPPTLHALDVLSKEGPIEGLRRLVQHGDEGLHPNKRFLESRTGIIGLPLVTPTLPPARETVSYLVGRDHALLVDVGSPFQGEIDRLVAMLEILRKDFGKELQALLLTHHHHDHVWGVNKLREQIDVPVWAHPITAERVAEMGIHVDRKIEGEPTLTLGKQSPFEVVVLQTPGHASGHLSVYEPTARSVIAGDLVAGQGTILIDPPDGDMDDYISSLAKIRALEPKTLFPSHGPVIADAVARLDLLIAHRIWREERILDLWNSGVRDMPELVAQAYSDAAPELLPFAERQALAHLARLRRHGRMGPPTEK